MCQKITFLEKRDWKRQILEYYNETRDYYYIRSLEFTYKASVVRLILYFAIPSRIEVQSS